DIGVAVLATEAQALAEVGAYDIAIQHFDVAPTLAQALLNNLGQGTLAGSRETCKPDGKTGVRHVNVFSSIIRFPCHEDMIQHALASLKCLALHISRNGHIELLQNRWSHIHQLEPAQFACTRAFVYIRVVFNDDTELSVVAVIGPGIVIEGIY